MEDKAVKGAPVIALIGRSGAGKDTQGQFLLGEFNAVTVSTGDLFRELASQEIPLGKFAKDILAEGRWNFLPPGTPPNYLPPGWLANFLWLKKMLSIPVSQAVISPSAPRRLDEGIMMDQAVQAMGRPPLVSVYIHIEEDVARDRLLNRRICKDCKTPVPMLVSTASWIACQLCEGELVRRHDDIPDAIEGRMLYFQESVTPLIEHFKKSGRLIWVEGNRPAEEVTADILKGVLQAFDQSPSQ